MQCVLQNSKAFAGGRVEDAVQPELVRIMSSTVRNTAHRNLAFGRG